MTNKKYREHPGVSSSQLKIIFNKTPFHYKYTEENPVEDKAALLFGRAAHKYILEKNDFFNEFAVAPVCDRRTKEGKEIYNSFLDASDGKDVITADDYQKILEMGSSIDAVPIARELLTGICEQSFFWTDTETQEKCKCRPDCMTTFNGQKYIVDYKTTDSCADGHFERTCKKYGYKLQAGMYCEGVFNNEFEEYGFAFVSQEKTAPYAVRVYICDSEFIKEGKDQFRTALNIYHTCKTEDRWYGYEGYYNTYETLYAEGD